MFITGVVNIVKMSHILVFICRFKEIPVKIPVGIFFKRNWLAGSKMHMEMQGT